MTLSLIRFPFAQLFCGLVCFCTLGCREQSSSKSNKTTSAAPRAAVTLQVLVVDDPDLATGLNLLRGEWAERSGGDFTVEQCTTQELVDRESLTTDLVVFPSSLLGELVMRDWLRPLRQSVLESDLLEFAGYFPAVRNGPMQLGGQYFGASLGEMPLGLGWRGEGELQPPQVWSQLTPDRFRLVLNQESKRQTPDDFWSAFPWAAEFVARAVAATKPAERATLFFSPQTFAAELTTPQLVQAAESIAALSKQTGVNPPFSIDVAVPPRGDRTTRSFLPLPGSVEQYEASLNRWAKADGRPAAIFGFAGRMVAVTESSRNAASAFQLLPWLVGDTNGERLSQRSKHTIWFRGSQAAQASGWLACDNEAEALSWINTALSANDAYFLPRVLQLGEYLSLLNDSVRKIAVERSDATKTLSATARSWEELTESIGRDRQIGAYRLHLGLEE